MTRILRVVQIKQLSQFTATSGRNRSDYRTTEGEPLTNISFRSAMGTTNDNRPQPIRVKQSFNNLLISMPAQTIKKQKSDRKYGTAADLNSLPKLTVSQKWLDEAHDEVFGGENEIRLV